MSLNIVDHSTLAVAGTSIGLSSASPTKVVAWAAGARQALIIVQGAPVFFRADGDAATSSDVLLNVGDCLPMLGDSMNQALDLLRFIRKTTTSATLQIIWYNREAVLTERIIRGAVRLVNEVGTPGVGHDITGIGHGVTTVTTAGTDVVLAASTAAKVVIIQSQTDNTGVIAVGASGVDATVATGTGVLLYAGDSIALEIDNLADVFIDATVSGEGVRYVYLS